LAPELLHSKADLLAAHNTSLYFASVTFTNQILTDDQKRNNCTAPMKLVVAPQDMRSNNYGMTIKTMSVISITELLDFPSSSTAVSTLFHFVERLDVCRARLSPRRFRK
jgi:hypothetical protein